VFNGVSPQRWVLPLAAHWYDVKEASRQGGAQMVRRHVQWAGILAATMFAALGGYQANGETASIPVALVEVAGGDAIDQVSHVCDGDAATETMFVHDPNLPGDIATVLTLDLKQPFVLEGLTVVNGQSKPVRWIEEIEVSGDGETFRPLLGRRVNLPMWRGGDRTNIPLGDAVGRYMRVHVGGVKQGALSELIPSGYPNYPERHVMCWSGDLERDYLAKLDYFEHELRATDLWLDFAETAFPQTNTNSGLELWADSGALDALARRGIRYWLGEHEAFTFMVNSPEDLRDEQRWLTTVQEMRRIYARARQLGFRGIVYDAEDYDGVPEEVREKYTDVADHVCAWTFNDEFGLSGMYYHRGRQAGEAMRGVWPGVVLMQVYEARMYAGIPGCSDGNYWWLKGIHDAGVEIWIATEKSYGAGENEMAAPDVPSHLVRWFVDPSSFVKDVHKAYPFAARVLPGYHPWNTRTRKPNYLPKYLDEQLEKTRGVARGCWIYCEGNAQGGDPREVLERTVCQKYAVTPEDYLAAFQRHQTSRDDK